MSKWRWWAGLCCGACLIGMVLETFDAPLGIIALAGVFWSPLYDAIAREVRDD